MLSSANPSRAIAVASTAGIVVRYAFYLFGALTFGMVAIAFVSLYGLRPQAFDREPAFQLAASDLSSLSKQSDVVEVAGTRLETWHYGRIYDRGRDLTVTLVMPPKGASIAKHVTNEMFDAAALRQARPILSSTYYDLETRFGPLRAVEMRINADGRQKLCLAFVSRFETSAAYLKGWTCEGNGSQPSAGALACTLDRFSLTAPLAAQDADAFFRGRLDKGRTCGASPVTQTTDTRPARYRPYRR